MLDRDFKIDDDDIFEFLRKFVQQIFDALLKHFFCSHDVRNKLTRIK